ncbi:MAG: YIP1 family protein [Paracoccaceae bacterium]
MGLSLDIVRSWRHPRQVMATRLSENQREDRALMYLMVACLLIFVSRWPGLAREARLDPSTPLDMRLGGALFAWLFIVPLACYAIAAVSRLGSRIVGGVGSGYSARLALFWSLLSASPFWLLNGLAKGFGQPGLLDNLIGALALAVFIVVWLSSLIQAEFGGGEM